MYVFYLNIFISSKSNQPGEYRKPYADTVNGNTPQVSGEDSRGTLHQDSDYNKHNKGLIYVNKDLGHYIEITTGAIR